MNFWEFVSQNAIAATVFLWFIYCVIDRIATALSERSTTHITRIAHACDQKPNADKKEKDVRL